MCVWRIYLKIWCNLHSISIVDWQMLDQFSRSNPTFPKHNL